MGKRTSRLLGGLVTGALLAAILAGCSAGDRSAEGLSDAIGSTSDINPVPREQVADGGNLRLSVGAYPANWNTLSVDGNEGDIASIVQPMMPRAFLSDPTGKLTVDTDFFTDVALTSTDPQQVTYTINPAAVWSDGSPLTWADIASQANALSGRDPRFAIAMSSGFDRVASVEPGVDDRQAVLTFERPYAEWRGQFAGNAMLYPKSVTADPAAFNDSLVDAMGLTAGPFRIQSTDRAQGRIVLERNPLWWGETAKLDNVTFSVLSSVARVSALQNDELDVSPLNSVDDVLLVGDTPGLEVRRAPGNRWRHLTFNGAPGSILADPGVRVAIGKAIDRQAIVSALQNGLVESPVPLNNHVYLQGQQGYRDNSLPFDPAAAERELDELGWARQGDIRVKDGRELVIRDVMYDDPTWVQIAGIIRNDLARIGVRLEIDTRPGAGFFTDVVQPGDFDAVQFIYQGDAFPLSSIPQIYGYYPDTLQSNFGRIGSPELNELIEATLSELDPQRAIELANEVDRAVFEEGHSLPLYQWDGSYGVRADLANFGSPGLASYDYTAIGFVR